MILQKKILFLVFLGITFLSTDCTGKEKKNAEQTMQQTTKGTTMTTQGKWQPPAASEVDPGKKYFAWIKTSKGNIKVELFAQDTPLSVTNFVQLSKKNFYNGLTFHRIVPGFVVQGGDPTGTGTGGPGYTIPAEIKRQHIEGALAWARLPETDPMGRPVNPEKRSSGSQFYITLKPQPSLDGGYTVFGQTVEGMDVVRQIEKGDTIQSIEIQTE